jgi:protein-tyrosine kinase
LLDTPAGLKNSEVQLLAAKAGGALLLARLHETRLANLEAIKHLFESTGVACVGTVINDF